MDYTTSTFKLSTIGYSMHNRIRRVVNLVSKDGMQSYNPPLMRYKQSWRVVSRGVAITSFALLNQQRSCSHRWPRYSNHTVKYV